MKVHELLIEKKTVAPGNDKPALPTGVSTEHEPDVDEGFQLLDGTNPTKPYTHDEIMKAMKELHARIERQAKHYGGKIKSDGTVDASDHKLFPAVIAHR